MNMFHRIAWAAALLVAASPAWAQMSNDVVKIGVLTDMTGPFADFAGPGSVAATELAVEDFGGKVAGKPIVMVVGDHQLKSDIATAKAREWFDTDGVDMINELTGSAIALAVSNIAHAKNRIAIVNSAATTALTEEQCTANTVHFSYDVYSLASTATEAIVRDHGRNWFFIAEDTAGGKALESTVADFLKQVGGTRVGGVRHPINTQDFASFLLQAQASKADVIALANSGSEFTNALKGATEFGIIKGGQKLAGTTVYITDIHGLGLNAAQGLLLATSFYWDFDDQTRAFAKRYFAKMNKMPTMAQAGTYASTRQYLKAVEAAGTDEAGAVMKKMRELPENGVFKNVQLRANGSVMHDMYLAQVKSPQESKGPWDYYKILAVVPADKAYQPAEKSKCGLVAGR